MRIHLKSKEGMFTLAKYDSTFLYIYIACQRKEIKVPVSDFRCLAGGKENFGLTQEQYSTFINTIQPVDREEEEEYMRAENEQEFNCIHEEALYLNWVWDTRHTWDEVNYSDLDTNRAWPEYPDYQGDDFDDDYPDHWHEDEEDYRDSFDWEEWASDRIKELEAEVLRLQALLKERS